MRTGHLRNVRPVYLRSCSSPPNPRWSNRNISHEGDPGTLQMTTILLKSLSHFQHSTWQTCQIPSGKIRRPRIRILPDGLQRQVRHHFRRFPKIPPLPHPSQWTRLQTIRHRESGPRTHRTRMHRLQYHSLRSTRPYTYYVSLFPTYISTTSVLHMILHKYKTCSYCQI